MFLLAIIVMGLVMINTLVIIGGALTFSQNSKYSIDSWQATNLAEAGIDQAVAAYNSSAGSYNPNPDEEIPIGDGTYTVAISSLSQSIKVIEATGYIPNKENPKSKRVVKIQVAKGVGVAFNYGVQVGDGGLYMEQQGLINGSIYSNGNIVIDQQSDITGSVFVAGGAQPVADQETDCLNPNCQDFIFGKSVGGNSQLDIAQSFQPTTTEVINKVALKLKKFVNPSNITVRILADNDGSPNKNQVLTSGTLNASAVTSTYGFIDVAFLASPTLTQDTTYWIVVDTSNNPNDYWAWSTDTLQSYTRGAAKWSANWQAGNPTWNSISGDLGFKVYMGGVNTYLRGANEVVIGGDAHANTLQDLEISKDAYYQTSSAITAANYYPNSADPPPIALPISKANIDEWKDQADGNNQPDDKVFTGDITNCPSTLVSGKYVGNITLPDHCNVTILTPIWITGNFTMNQQSKIRLDSSYGAASGNFIVDGQVSIDQQNHLQGSCGLDTCINGSYLILISEFNSKDDPQERNAIHIIQQGNTGVLYSNLGTIRVDQQNDFGEITAWKVSLGQQMILTYDQGLAGAFFSSGPSGSFSVIKGSYQAE